VDWEIQIPWEESPATSLFPSAEMLAASQAIGGTLLDIQVAPQLVELKYGVTSLDPSAEEITRLSRI
jgi:hypothetical protein